MSWQSGRGLGCGVSAEDGALTPGNPKIVRGANAYPDVIRRREAELQEEASPMKGWAQYEKWWPEVTLDEATPEHERGLARSKPGAPASTSGPRLRMRAGKGSGRKQQAALHRFKEHRRELPPKLPPDFALRLNLLESPDVRARVSFSSTD